MKKRKKSVDRSACLVRTLGNDASTGIVTTQFLLDTWNMALEEACGIVFGMCESDNVAQRTVNAIRALKRGGK